MMKIAAIVLFVLSALAAIRPVLQIPVGIAMLGDPNSGLSFDMFVPQTVGMLLVPMVLLILGLVCWNKASQNKSSRRRSSGRR